MRTWSRTLSTAGSPTAVRWVLTGSPNSAFMVPMLSSHSSRLSVTPAGYGCHGYSNGGWCGDGSTVGCRATYAKRAPSLSAAACAPATAGNSPVAATTPSGSATASTPS